MINFFKRLFGIKTVSTLKLRHAFTRIALRDVGEVETSRNQGPGIKKFWGATWYPRGFINREPYCAAAGCYWLREWLKDAKVLKALNLTAKEAEQWRCKSPRAFDWTKWAYDEGLHVFGDSSDEDIHVGDIMIFDISHYGVVHEVEPNGQFVITIEANTGADGERDGDGIFLKRRHRRAAREFIRLLS